MTTSPRRSPETRYGALTKLCMWGRVGDVINHVQFHLNRFGVLDPRGVEFPNLPLTVWMALTTVLRTNVLHCDRSGANVILRSMYRMVHKNCTSIILALGTTFANVNRFKNYLTHCWLFNKCAAFWLQVVYNVSSWSQFCAYITELLQLLYCIQSVMSKGKELESMVPSFQTLHQNIITGSL